MEIIFTFDSMKNSFLFIIISLVAFACNFSKKANMQIKNNNEYPITLTFITNNIQQVYGKIEPNQKRNDTYDWTKLEKTDGEFLIVIKNEINQQVDTFHHGQYLKGELGNYIDIESYQGELKVVVSD
jgi:hypothetical protein